MEGRDVYYFWALPPNLGTPQLQPNAEDPVENSDTLSPGEDDTAASWKDPRALNNSMHQSILVSKNPLVHWTVTGLRKKICPVSCDQDLELLLQQLALLYLANSYGIEKIFPILLGLSRNY